jgi:vesicle coat complex subunit
MGFYDLSKDERQKIVYETEEAILSSIKSLNMVNNSIRIFPDDILKYASNGDTYMRKNAYMAIGRIYCDNEDLRENLLLVLDEMLGNSDEKVRQTAVYALGEIGKKDADSILNTFERALKDKHHSVRNAVIGALKQMGQKNPEPTFKFAKMHLHDKDPKTRRQIVHGIELRGRTHPEEVLPLLEELQDEKVKEVRNMVIHVIGQISYKTGCLERVVDSLNGWQNRKLVNDAVEEILKVHKNYKFSARSPLEAEGYINENLIDF